MARERKVTPTTLSSSLEEHYWSLFNTLFLENRKLEQRRYFAREIPYRGEIPRRQQPTLYD